MAKPKLGSGERFKQLESKLEAKGASNPAALAAYIGRKKYGKEKFQKLSTQGKTKGGKVEPHTRCPECGVDHMPEGW